MDLPTSTDILIIGAGPTGLALATALRRRGAGALVIDRQTEGANTSRAAVVHARTLEILEPLGITSDLLAQGIKVPTFRVRDRARTLATVSFEHLPTAYPFTLMIPQDRTEAILLARLQALGGEVLRPAEATAIRPGPASVDVDVAHDGERHTVTARWLVGCDGAHSRVREAAGIEFDGGTYAEDFVLADVHMPWPISRDEVTLFLSTEGFLMVAPLPGAADHYRIVATSDAAPAQPDAAFMQAIVDERGPADHADKNHAGKIHAGKIRAGRIRETIWSSRFRIHHRVTATPWAGRMLVCGDAAHLHSPAGGQGMNTGIQDAVTLAEPLLEALRTGSDAGLDSWAQSRHRVAKEVIGLTDRMTRAAALSSRAGRMVRNTAISFVNHFPAAREALARRFAELDNA